MKIIFLSDTHLGFDYPIRPRSARKRRGASFYNNFDTVLQYAKAQKADLVLHGGDFFFRSKLNNLVIDKAYLMLDKFHQANIPFVVIPGNHERSRLPSSFVLNYPNLHAIGGLQQLDFSSDELNLKITGFPYQKNIRQRFSTLMQQVNFDPKYFNLLLLHQIFAGAKVGFHNYTFRSGSEVIRNEDIPSELDLILCGHIHRKQSVSYTTPKSKKIPIIFSGSTQRTSYQENCEVKGFYEIELFADKSIQTKFIQLPAELVEKRKF
jgi:DNA repair exonuclease SbcCD nuclease subunit